MNLRTQVLPSLELETDYVGGGAGCWENVNKVMTHHICSCLRLLLRNVGFWQPPWSHTEQPVSPSCPMTKASLSPKRSLILLIMSEVEVHGRSSWQLEQGVGCLGKRQEVSVLSFIHALSRQETPSLQLPSSWHARLQVLFNRKKKHLIYNQNIWKTLPRNNRKN